MSKRVTLAFVRSDYASYSVVAASVQLTSRQCALIESVFALMYLRAAWEKMSDSEWDALEGELSAISEVLQTP